MILTSSHSKECFCHFVAKLRCCQVFLQRKRSPHVCGFITLIVAVSHSNESFSCFSPKLQCPDFFRTGNGFELFEANHVVLT